MERLDRMPSARQAAQVGAALGRQFSHELLQAAAEMPERQLNDALEQLVRAELLFRHGPISGKWVSYAFAIRACSRWRSARSRLGATDALGLTRAWSGLPLVQSDGTFIASMN
jgi:hypothetical protein